MSDSQKLHKSSCWLPRSGVAAAAADLISLRAPMQQSSEPAAAAAAKQADMLVSAADVDAKWAAGKAVEAGQRARQLRQRQQQQPGSFWLQASTVSCHRSPSGVLLLPNKAAAVLCPKFAPSMTAAELSRRREASFKAAAAPVEQAQAVITNAGSPYPYAVQLLQAADQLAFLLQQHQQLVQQHVAPTDLQHPSYTAQYEAAARLKALTDQVIRAQRHCAGLMPAAAAAAAAAVPGETQQD